MVHNALDGIMVYFQSPIDPVFYTHHGVIDLLQTLYLKCQLKSETAKLTLYQKGSDRRVWSNCPRRNGVLFKNTDTITMRTRDYKGNWVHVRTNPNNMLYPFFKDIPGRFVDYVDAKDLGIYSYTYQMQGALTNMFKNCKASNTISSAVLLADDALAMQKRQDDKEYNLRPILDGPTASDTKFRHWTIAAYESAKLAGYTTEAARDQMELMLCVHSDECLGGVADYSDLFRKNFGVTGHPRCFTLLEQLSTGKKIIGVPEWHDISSKFLSCPKPKVNADGTVHHHHADDATTSEDGTTKVSMEFMLEDGATAAEAR
jgi:tyrosinase